MALGHIANSAELTAIDPPDGSAEADHCATFYPMARDECLESHAWSFATQRATLAELATNAQEDIWAYAYALPNQLIKVLAVLLPGAPDDTDTQPFLVETLENGSQVLYTNVEDAVLRFIWRQEDPAKFTPLFTIALSYKLAAYLAGPIPKDLNLKKTLEQVAELKLGQAAASNKAQKVNTYKDFIPSQLAARGT